jgi:hypothetical protein
MGCGTIARVLRSGSGTYPREAIKEGEKMAARRAKKTRKTKKKSSVASKNRTKTVKGGKRRATKARSSKAKSRKAKPLKSKAARAKPARAKGRAKPRKEVFGEGNYTAAREFRNAETDFVEKNRKRIPEMGKAAERALEGPQGDELRSAEQQAAAHAHMKEA